MKSILPFVVTTLLILGCTGEPSDTTTDTTLTDSISTDGTLDTGEADSSGEDTTGDVGEASCSDGVQNGDEAGVDCGGSQCVGCASGTTCTAAEDCLSGVCAEGTCEEPSCDDTMQNGFESDVDCGGECDACAAGQTCFESADCLDGSCSPEGVCVTENCTDNVLNNEETDTDCGGPNCARCTEGKACDRSVDCESLVCDTTTKLCLAGGCNDFVQNGTESDIDCGGDTCEGCDPGGLCTTGDDCVSAVCSDQGTCVSGSCTDEVQNGTETDVDCGGGDCAICDVGAACAGNSDCLSGRCENAVCGEYFTNCAEILDFQSKALSGIYRIDPDGPLVAEDAVEVFCDMATEGGGWTLISNYRAREGDLLVGPGYCNARSRSRTDLCSGHINPSQIENVTEVLIYDNVTQDYMVLKGFDNTSSDSALQYLANQKKLTTSSLCSPCLSATLDPNLDIATTSYPFSSTVRPLFQTWRYGGWEVFDRPSSSDRYALFRSNNIATEMFSRTGGFLDFTQFTAGPLAIMYR